MSLFVIDYQELNNVLVKSTLLNIRNEQHSDTVLSTRTFQQEGPAGFSFRRFPLKHVQYNPLRRLTWQEADTAVEVVCALCYQSGITPV